MTAKVIEQAQSSAGGLVWQVGFDSRKIVIVHRKRYGGEWTLPKGHLQLRIQDNGELVVEDWEEAAKREVAEETKCNSIDLKIDTAAGTLSYIVKGRHKVVSFFNMTCTGDCEFNKKIENDLEVDEVKLVDVNYALALLKYPEERSLVRKVEQIEDLKPVRLFWLRKALKSSSHRRLSETIGPFEIELKDKINEILGQLTRKIEVETNQEKKKLIEEELERVRRKSYASLEALEYAKKALSVGEIEVGWRYLFQADLEQTLIVADEPTNITADNSSSLRRIAISTLNEAEKKLRLWRLKTVQDYLGKEGKLKEKITPGDVYRSRKIMQEEFTNMYIKLHTAGFQLGILALIAIALVFPVIVLLPSLSPVVGLNNTGLIAAIAMFGALGGCFSGIFSISREAGAGRIPDQILLSWVTLARPVVGVIAALAISSFLLSGLIQLGSLTVPLVLAVSFAVGFSERLLVKALELKTS